MLNVERGTWQLRNSDCGVRNGKPGLFVRWKETVRQGESSCWGWSGDTAAVRRAARKFR
jgi:hypothetical protein